MVDYDVLVVGGGILGLAAAYYVKHAHRELSVAILEKEKDVGQGNTAKSVGGYRHGIFTSRVNQMLAETTVEHFRAVEEVGESKLNMRDVGYLILLDKSRLEKVGQIVNYFVKTGKALLLNQRELSENFGLRTSFTGDEEATLMGLEDILNGLFAPKCGMLDVEKVVELYKRRCVDEGVEIITGVRAEKLFLEPERPLGIQNEPRAWQKSRIGGVVANDTTFKAKSVIVAAGSWTPDLLDPLGVDCFVKPKKRQLYVIKGSNELEALLNKQWDGNRQLPMMFFPNGLYMVPRIEEKSFWVSLTDEVGRPFAHDYEPDPRFYYENVYPLLCQYYPQFSGARPYSMWAGCYSMNNLDGNPFVFKFLNCVVATGGSGSGVMKSDAIGRIAEAVLFDKPYAILYGGVKFEVDKIGVFNRQVDKEYFIL
ncbi:MAG: FAD-binding oxidoreductase [Candidatus Caldarchaeum sp.]